MEIEKGEGKGKVGESGMYREREWEGEEDGRGREIKIEKRGG